MADAQADLGLHCLHMPEDKFSHRTAQLILLCEAVRRKSPSHCDTYRPAMKNYKRWYGKCPKISNILFHTFLALTLLFMQFFIKIPNGNANSGDPDQTAPSGAVWSGSALFTYGILSDTSVLEILAQLPYLGNVTIMKYNLSKALKEEIRNIQWQKKRHIRNHQHIKENKLSDQPTVFTLNIGTP